MHQFIVVRIGSEISEDNFNAWVLVKRISIDRSWGINY